MRLFTSIAALRCYLELYRSGLHQFASPMSDGDPSAWAVDAGAGIGLVPTMGALHEGHLSLIQRARRENGIVVVSVFVNPLQFAPTEDLDRYPRTLDRDRELCHQAGVDVVFAPIPVELGILASSTHALSGLTQVVPSLEMRQGLCGRSRPDHFQGVATIVSKLLHLVQPDRAYFGRKDAQQVAIIRRLVADLNLPVEIVPCPTVRDTDGLALSSRNQYLSAAERSVATTLYRSLQTAVAAFRAGERCSQVLIDAVATELASQPLIEVEYVELVHPENLVPLDTVEDSGLLAIAARIGTTRLIDNVVLQTRQPIVAIDGPAGAGKSTVTRQVAKQLKLLYLDTGAMYRAVTWWVLQSSVDMTDQPAIAELVHQCEIEFRCPDGQVEGEHEPDVWVNGQNVTQAIRSPEVTAHVSAIAAQPSVRRALVKQQQRYGQQGGLVAEGRDIGTHVFPDAELKIFLTASVQERARRRQLDLQERGQPVPSLVELQQAISDRDWQDSTRSFAPLRRAEGAIELLTDNLTIEQVVAEIVSLYRQRCVSPTEA